MDMRSSVFSRFDRDLVYYRERPARRFAERFSLLFLVSLAAVATLTTAPADRGQHDMAPIAGGTAVANPGSH
jgi:hypothetical protein